MAPRGRPPANPVDTVSGRDVEIARSLANETSLAAKGAFPDANRIFRDLQLQNGLVSAFARGEQCSSSTNNRLPSGVKNPFYGAKCISGFLPSPRFVSILLCAPLSRSHFCVRRPLARSSLISRSNNSTSYQQTYTMSLSVERTKTKVLPTITSAKGHGKYMPIYGAKSAYITQKSVYSPGRL
jgi:hypothetical protein